MGSSGIKVLNIKDYMEFILVILVLFGATSWSQGDQDMNLVPGGPAAKEVGIDPDWFSIADTACSAYGGNIGIIDPAYAMSSILQESCPSYKPCVLAINPQTFTYTNSQFTNYAVQYPTISLINGYTPGMDYGCIVVIVQNYYAYFRHSTDCTGALLCTISGTGPTTEEWAWWTTSGPDYGQNFVASYTAAPYGESPPWSYLWQYCGNNQIAILRSQNDEQYITYSLCPDYQPCVLAINPETYRWTRPDGEEQVVYPQTYQISGYYGYATSGCITVSVTSYSTSPFYSYSQNCNGLLLCSNSVTGTTTTTTWWPWWTTTTNDSVSGSGWAWWTTSSPDYVNSTDTVSISGWISSFFDAVFIVN